MNFQVSPEDEWLLAAYAWNLHPLGYAQASTRVGGRPWVVLLHRLVMDAPAGVCVDHIDGNPSNNRRENLRLCSRSENQRNRKIGKNNKCGVKGVYEDRGRFRAQINVDGRRIRLGRFPSAEEAGQAYNAAAIRYHGEFARLN